MMLATSGLVLHVTPYGEASVVTRVFTKQLGVRSYIVKSVRGPAGRVKMNVLQPLSPINMVVYDNHKKELNHVREFSPRYPGQPSDAVGNALRFFMTEVLLKALREAEPMPELWDYVEQTLLSLRNAPATTPISFLLTVARHLGIEPLDNQSSREPLFDLQEGRYVSAATETTLPPTLSSMLHDFLSAGPDTQTSAYTLPERRALIDALLAYYQLHLSGFHKFHSHEILHTVLK